ncbi:MAG: FAD binding domain-containing protein [Acidimicrobiia bacterium]
MKPAPFTYVRPSTIDEALEFLAASHDGKVIAGGQSLLPLMNFRLARPGLLIDVGRIPELSEIVIQPTTLELGAMTRHSRVELDPTIASAHPLLSFAASQIGHRAIRNHGTIGGSIAHADAAAEYPAVLTAVSGSVTTRSPRGERTVPANDLFIGHYATDLAEDEIIIRVTVPRVSPGQRWGFFESSRRPGDFAESGAVALVTTGADRYDIRVVTFATTSRPVAIEISSGPADVDRSLVSAVIEHTSTLDERERDLTVVAVRRAVGMALNGVSKGGAR